MFLLSNNGLGGELSGICGPDYIRDILLTLFYSSLRKPLFFYCYNICPMERLYSILKIIEHMCIYN